VNKTFAFIAALALPVAAQAASFQNGSFETGPAAGSFTTLGAGDTSITGWTVGGNSIDYIGSYWNAQDGSRSVDLSGNGPGSVSQTFDTILNRRYTVTFWLAGNTDGAPTVKSTIVSAGGPGTTFTFDTTGDAIPGLDWKKYSYSFTATGGSTTLSFAAGDGGSYGAALDNVSVLGVPEPAQWALMIGGFGLIGAASRRRRVVVA
jgi:choice-of-anchor C domain-containing protein